MAYADVDSSPIWRGDGGEMEATVAEGINGYAVSTGGYDTGAKQQPTPLDHLKRFRQEAEKELAYRIAEAETATMHQRRAAELCDQAKIIHEMACQAIDRCESSATDAPPTLSQPWVAERRY